MKILNKIKNYFVTKALNKKFAKYKYVHIMFNDKFNKPFVDFLNRNFDSKEHLVLCKKYFKEHPFPTGKNVVEISFIKGFNFDKNEKIICHSLFDVELVDYLYKNQNILKEKAYWVIWGGDLYGAVRDEKNDFVRANFKGVVSLMPGDENVVKDVYKSNPEVCFAPYIFPINEEILKDLNHTKQDFIKIQINNSCDKSTIEMLEVLSKFKDENIKITTILSYGQTQFKEEIVDKGKEIFGDKFEYIENYMSPEEYAKHLAENDILILNQNRQQGVGNTVASACLGTKIYIKENVSTNKYFNSIGIKIYNTEDINSCSFSNLTEYKCKDETIKKAKEYNSEKHFVEKWEKVFS